MAALAGPALGGDNDGDDEPIDVTLARLGIAPLTLLRVDLKEKRMGEGGVS